jgi:hypothetical protein
MLPVEVADIAFDAPRSGKFYIITHASTKLGVQMRTNNILQGRAPADALHFARQAPAQGGVNEVIAALVNILYPDRRRQL